MDNTLDYIADLPTDTKLIIVSKLPVELLSKAKLGDTVAEILFKYRYPITYYKFKNIIKLNKSLDFDDYISEGPYFWKIMLDSQFGYEKKIIKSPEYLSDAFHTWWEFVEHMNMISISMHCLSKFYDNFPKFYSHVKFFTQYKTGVYLLNESITSSIEVSGVIVFRILRSGDLEQIYVDVNSYGNSGLESIDIIYFFKQFMLIGMLTIDFNDLNDLMTNVRNQNIDRDEWSTLDLYYNHKDTFEEIYRLIKSD